VWLLFIHYFSSYPISDIYRFVHLWGHFAASFWPRKHPAVSRRQCPSALHFMDYDIMLPSNSSNSEIRFNLCDEGFAAAAAVWNHF